MILAHELNTKIKLAGIKTLMLFLSIALALPLTGCEPRGSDERAQALSFLNPQRDFTLTDQDGKEFYLKDHRGKVILLFFGYLSCPDVCPVTLSKLSRAYAKLGGKANDVLTIFVSVDPGRDTPEKLKEYLKYFKLNILGLTGTKEQIDKVVDAFKGYYKKTDSNSKMGYFVDHSDYVYVINKQGVVCELIRFDDSTDKTAEMIRKAICRQS